MLMPMRMRMGSVEVGDPLGDRSLHAQRCPHGPLGVVLVGDGRAEQGDDGVTEDLVDPAPEAGHVLHQALEQPVDERLDLLGVDALGLAGEADEIGEEDGDDPALLAAARPRAWPQFGQKRAPSGIGRSAHEGQTDIHRRSVRQRRPSRCPRLSTRFGPRRER